MVIAKPDLLAQKRCYLSPDRNKQVYLVNTAYFVSSRVYPAARHVATWASEVDVLQPLGD